MIFQNLFKAKEPKLEDYLKDAELSLQVAGDTARRCLSMEEFKVYRDSLKRNEAELMDSLIAYTNHFSLSEDGDVTKYAMKVSRLITKAETLRKLLNDIESNAKRGIGKNE